MNSTKTPAQILGAAICARRQATHVERGGRRLQMSQQELADAAGCAKNHISDIERGRKWPGSALLARIATALGCEVRILLRRQPHSDPAHSEHDRALLSWLLLLDVEPAIVAAARKEALAMPEPERSEVAGSLFRRVSLEPIE